MSFVRRVQSFTTKKIQNGEEENVHKRRKKKISLHRQKSISMETVPMMIHLEQSELFNKQRKKCNENENLGLQRRISLSCDENHFVRTCTTSSERRNHQNQINTTSVDLFKELVKEFSEKNEDDDEDQASNNRPGHFPVYLEDLENGVEVRRRPSGRLERPKTYSNTTSKRKEVDVFEIRGPFSLEIEDEQCLKIKASEKILLTGGNMHIQTLTGIQIKTIKTNVNFQKNSISNDKKIVTIKDTHNVLYTFYFKTAKEAKQFVDNEKSHNLHSIEKTSIKWKLLKLLGKRSSRDFLELKGIIRNEPIFGNTIEALYEISRGIPEFISSTVTLLEMAPNIKSLGIYRASANLATVQKIRFEVDNGRLSVLKQYKHDVDVLTGTLKLFFRELKEPLISYECYRAIQSAIDSGKMAEIREAIRGLPQPNYETLRYILAHLLRVCSHKAENKMDVHNISVAWGPSMVAIPDTCADLVIQTTQFYLMTEFLLNNYVDIFGDVVGPRDFVYEVIEKVTSLIEASLDVEGIYRKSGSSTQIEKLVEKLDKHKLDEIGPNKDVHDLCCALKRHLANLSEPLIPYFVFDRYCNDCDKLGEAECQEEFRKNIQQIPKKDALFLLLAHLRRVVQHESRNKMSLHTLTSMWMGTLINPLSQQDRDKTARFCKFLERLIMGVENLPDLLCDSDVLPRFSKYDNLEKEAVFLDDKL